MATSLGTAFIRVRGDLSHLRAQLVSTLAPTKLSKLGKGAGVALGAGLVAGGAGKGLFELGKSFDEAFDTIRVGTGKTGASLKDLEDDFKNVLKTTPTDFASAGDAISQLNQRLGLTGEPLRDLSAQMLNLSRITKTDLSENIESVARAFEDWEVPVRRQSKALDGLFRLGQKSGASVSQLASSVQKFGSPLRILGFSLGEAAATFATFERAGVNTQTMVPGLKLAIANLTRPTSGLATQMDKLGISAGKPEEGLRKVFALLGDKSTLSNTEKIGLAMDVFGRRAGADMAEAIRQGRFEVDEMFKTFEGGGDSINKAEQDTRDFGEEWQLLKQRLAVGLEPLATAVFRDVGRIVKILGDPDLSGSQKWDKIEGIIVPAFEKALEGASQAAERYGPKIAGKLVTGFLNAPVLVQLLGGAWLLKKAAPMIAASGLLGRQSGAAFAAGMNTTVATQAGGGAAGGAAAGGLAGFGARMAKFAKIGVGVAVGAAILEGIRLRLQDGDPGLEEKVKQLQAPGVLGTRKLLGGAQNLVAKVPGFGAADDKGTFGFELRKSKALKQVFDEINTASANRLPVLRRQADEAAKQLDLTTKQKDELAGMFRLRATADVSKALGGVVAASGAARDSLPAVVSAQKRVNELRAQGKTDTQAYAEAIRALDAAEATRATATRARTDQQQKALAATRRDLGLAFAHLETDKKLGASKEQLAKDIRQVAQAASRQYAALANVDRAMRGLTPVTGKAGTQMGQLLKQFKGLEGVGKFRKFLVTADVSSVEKGIKLASKLQGLGRGKTVMKIFAESKSPEEALRKLQALAKKLTEKRHKVEVFLRDLATRGLHDIEGMVKHLPNGKISVDVVAGKISIADRLDRLVADSLSRAGLGQAAKQLRVTGRARGGRTKPDEALTLVGEEGFELGKLPTGKLTMLGQEGPEIRELPVGTRVYSHPETKSKLATLTQRVIQKLVPAAIGQPSPLVQRVTQQTLGTDSRRQSPGAPVPGALRGLTEARFAEEAGFPAFERGGRLLWKPRRGQSVFKRRKPSRKDRRRGDRIAAEQERERSRATPIAFKPRLGKSVFEHRIPSKEDRERGEQIARKQERQRGRKEKRQDLRKRKRHALDDFRLRTGLGGITPYQRKHGETEAGTVRREGFRGVLGLDRRSPISAALESIMLGGPSGAIKTSARLTRAEQQAILKYQGTGYHDLNKALREGKEVDPVFLGALDKALGKGRRLKQDVELHRGVRARAVRDKGRQTSGAKHFESLKVGDEFTDKGFFSTTTDRGKLGPHGSRYRFKIKAKKGSRVLDLGGAEREVLLPRKSRFRVLDRKERRGFRVPLGGGHSLPLEGSETVITLQMLKRGGLVKAAQARGIPGFAKGSKVGKGPDSKKPPIRELLERIWTVAAPFYGQSSEAAMPPTGIVKSFQTSTLTDAAGKAERVYIHRDDARGLLRGKPRDMSNVVHEWAHYFQNPKLRKDWKVEGGAEAFARSVAPDIYGALQMPYASPSMNGAYAPFVRRVRKEKGQPWIMRGQFGRERTEEGGGDSDKPGGRLARTSQLADVSVTPSEVSAITQKWDVNRAIASIGAAVKDKYPAMKITSGFRARAKTPSGSPSNHSIHAALDLGTGRNFSLNRRISAWVRSNFPASLRGVSEPVLDVDYDAAHADHVHVAALGSQAIAKVMEAGGDGPGEKKAGPKRITGGRLSLEQMVTLAKQAGFPDPAEAAAIGYVESKFGQVRAHNTDGEDSRGLWQINVGPGANTKYKDWNLFDARVNAKAAFKISKGGKDWSPWTVYTSGRHRPYLGAKGKPLPKGTSKGTSGDSYADYLTMKLTEAEGTQADPKDDIRWINRAMRYWRGIARRSRGNHDRRNTALGELNSLRSKKQQIREELEDPNVFKLDNLTTIGTGPNAFKIGPLNQTLDQIELEKALAALTVPADDDDSPTALKASLQDDIAAASKAVGIWEGLHKLTTGMWVTPQIPPPADAPARIAQITRDIKAEKAKRKPDRKRIERLEERRQRLKGPTGGNYVVGTIGQQIEAATTLGSARIDLKSLKAEIGDEGPVPRLRALAALAALTPGKEDDVAAAKEAVNQYQADLSAAQAGGDFSKIAEAAEALKGAQDELKSLTGAIAQEKSSFIASMFQLQKDFLPNFRKLPSFEGGGFVKGPLGKPQQAIVHGGELVTDPRTGEQHVVVKDERKDSQRPNVIQHITFETQPKDMHAFTKSALAELEAAI